MKILDELQTICNINNVLMEKMVVTYAPEEGLNVWWITSAVGDGYKWPEFVIEALEMDKRQQWWVKKAFDSMDWHNCYLVDVDKVELGPYPFAKKVSEFLNYYQGLYRAIERPSEETCNAIGVDYNRIKTMRTPPQAPRRPVINLKGIAPEMKAVSFDEVMRDRDFPVSYVVEGNHFQNLKDVDRFVRYAKLRKLMFNGHNIYDETQMDIIRRMIQNQDLVIRLLKGL